MTEFTEILIALEEAHWLAELEREPHAVIARGEHYAVLPLSQATAWRVLEVCR